MTWLGRLAPMIVAVAMLAGCTSSNPTANTSSGGASNAGKCNEPCVLFHVQINLTGLDNVQGSFVDIDSGTGYSSCAEFAKGDSVGFVQGPGSNTIPTTVIAGKTLNFLFRVNKDRFHGPGTYSNTLLAGITIGADTFVGGTSSETLNADGSGQASLANYSGGRSTGPQGNESGTVSWTCSK
ncbi:MAG TPA: hypothetical protein VGV88_11045 [Candidatus Dormibacteraeota bacterium]|nr:hypothetical protein [Candidatus Dormibacteraeota bacterium]